MSDTKSPPLAEPCVDCRTGIYQWVTKDDFIAGITIKDLRHQVCDNCGEAVYGAPALERISREVREHKERKQQWTK